MQKTLHEHVAIISGGLGDIGQCIAHELASRGANIALCDLQAPQQADRVLDSLRQRGVQAHYAQVDVGDAAAVGAWIDAVEAELGIATLIVPNAAIVTLKNALDITPEEWQRELRVNLDGAFHVAQAGAKRLRHHERAGRIVFIGSWAAHAPHSHIAAYSVAKAGMRMLSQCLALDLAPHGITVNEVAPGYVNAGLSAQIWEKHPHLRQKAVGKVPVRLLIEPEEVALQVAYLCEESSRHITGSTLLMDGGLSLLSGASS